MAFSEGIISIVKYFEKFNSTPYKDSGSYAIGYGNHQYEDEQQIDGKYRQVQSSDVGITETKANSMMLAALSHRLDSVKKIINRNDLTESQLEALASFKYNCNGLSGNSSVIKAINEDPDGSNIEKLFLQWCHDGNGQVINGLLRRRAVEYKFYKTGEVDFDVKYDVPESGSQSNSGSSQEIKYVNTNECGSIICRTDDGEPYANIGEGNIGYFYGMEDKPRILSYMDIVITLYDRGFKFVDWKCEGEFFNKPIGKNVIRLKCTVKKRGIVTGVSPELTVCVTEDSSYAMSMNRKIDYEGIYNFISHDSSVSGLIPIVHTNNDVAKAVMVLPDDYAWYDTMHELDSVLIKCEKVCRGRELFNRFDDIMNTRFDSKHSMFEELETFYCYKKMKCGSVLSSVFKENTEFDKISDELIAKYAKENMKKYYKVHYGSIDPKYVVGYAYVFKTGKVVKWDYDDGKQYIINNVTKSR